MDFYLSTGMSSSPDFDDAFHLGCRHDSYCYRQHSFSPTTILLRTTPTQGFKPFTVENDSRQNFPLSGFYNLLCPFPTLSPSPLFISPSYEFCHEWLFHSNNILPQLWSVNPPNMVLLNLAIVKVAPFPSHFSWKILLSHPSLAAL